MARFQITGPDGSYEVDAPDTASEKDVMAYFHAQTGTRPSAPERTGTIAAAAEGIGQGLSFGFSDEIEGGVRALIDKIQNPQKEWSQAWDEGVGAPRERQKQAGETNPWAYYGGQIAGGIALPVGAAGLGIRGAAAAGTGLRARSLAAAGEGGAYGAAYGAGTTEGGLVDRALGAGKGAVTGAVVGGALPVTTDVVAAGVRGLTAPLKGVLTPERFGREKIAEALLRDRNPTGAAQRTAPGVESDLSRLRTDTGKDLRMMDMGGANTRNLMRAASNMASTGAQRLNRTLDTRQAGQWRRIERNMARGLGSPDDYATAVGDLVSQRAANARVNYDAANAVETPMTDRLRAVLARPIFSGRMDGQNTGGAGLIRLANESLANEGTQIGLQTRTQALHYVKMQIDKQIGAARRAQQMGNSPPAGWDVRTLTIAKRDLLDAMENDTYKAANRAFAGESALVNAAEDGFENALKMPTEEIAPMLAAMTPGEQEMWRMGASRALAQKLRSGNVMHDRTDKIFSSPDIHARMQAFFPNNRARREFQRDLILEARQADMRKAVQGNSTTAKQLAQGDEAGQPVQAAAALANGAAGRLGPLLDFLGRQANRATGLTPRTANALIDAGLARGGDDVSQALSNALARASAAPERRAVQVHRGNAAANALMAGNEGIGYDEPSGLRGGIGPRYDEYGRLRPGQQR